MKCGHHCYAGRVECVKRAPSGPSYLLTQQTYHPHAQQDIKHRRVDRLSHRITPSHTMAGLTSIGYVFVLSLFSTVVVGHENDRVCYPSPTTGSPETVRVPARSQEMHFGETNQQISDSSVTSVEIIHKYINDNGYELAQIIRKAVIIINSGERHVEALNARSFSDANLRELMLEFDGNVVTAAIGKYHQYHNSVTLETKTEWTCERRSLGLGAVITTAFSENGSYRNDQTTWLQDFIDIKVANKYQPISQE